MKTFKEITEVKKMTAKDVAKILQSDDFGMTEAGGNGDAKASKGKLIIKDTCFYGCEKAGDKLKADWSPGGVYHNYFKADFGANLKVDKVDIAFTGGKIFGKKAKDGVITLTISVS